MVRMRSVTPPGAGFDVRWVELGGTGRTIAYLHGWGCSSSSSFADAARRSGRPGALIDLVGHGLSDRPPAFGYGHGEHADAVAAAVRACSDEPVDIVGHSAGGSLALVLTHRHPEIVRRAVLVEPGIDPFPVEPQHWAAFDEDDLLADDARSALAVETWDRRAEMQLADPIALRRIAASMHEALGDALHGMIVTPAVPTLVVVGGHRAYRDEHEFGAELVRIPEAGHFVMNETPEQYDAAVLGFLDETP